jgi:hypothetical protein
MHGQPIIMLQARSVKGGLLVSRLPMGRLASAIEFNDKNEWSYIFPPLPCTLWRGHGRLYRLSIDLVEICAVCEWCYQSASPPPSKKTVIFNFWAPCSPILRTDSIGATYDRQCHLALSARCIQTDTYFCMQRKKFQQLTL